VGVINVDGTFYAVRNVCPHQGAPLCLGRLGGTMLPSAPGEFEYGLVGRVLRCPWHGWEYDIATGQSWCNPDRTRARPFSVGLERGDQVATELAAGSARGATGDAQVVDPVRHRVKGPFVAQVLPIEVEDEYIVVSLARLAPAPRKE
jgi:nitrite reductase/ring-hydroxylating ferredoxin subunit